MKKEPLNIFFGALKDRCSKAILGYKNKKNNRYELHIYEVNGNYHTGDKELDMSDITGEYAVLTFCKRESLKAMIKVLQELDSLWEKEENTAKINIDAEELRRKILKEIAV